MSEKAEKLAELKTIINSLVIPNPEGLSLRHLCNDYKDLEGEMIPYHEFGFSSVTALLKSMPDKIRMIGQLSDINSVILFPVKDESTKHIIDLVQRQAKNRKKSSRRPLPRFASWSRPPPVHRPLSRSANNYRTNVFNPNVSHFSRPTVQTSPQNWRTNIPMAVPTMPTIPPLLSTPVANGFNPRQDFSKPTANMTLLGEKFLNFRITKTLNKLNEQSKPSPMTRSATDLNAVQNGFAMESTPRPISSSNGGPIPDRIKDNIRLMMSSPDIEEGFMLFNFDARYRHQFKEGFDYKRYGFENLTDCLKSMPNVLDMIPTGTKTYKLMPLKNSGQTKPESVSKPNISVPTTTTVITNGNSIAFITSTATSTSVTIVTTQSPQTKSIVSTTANRLFRVSASEDKGQKVAEKVFKPIEVKTKVPETVFKPIEVKTKVPETMFKPIEVKTKVSETLFCPIETPKSEISFDNQSIGSSASADANLINNKAKQNFRTILLFNENGINALDFGAEYQKYFKATFDSRIWGFKSHMELFHGLPQIFAIEVNDKNEEILHDSRFKKFEKPKHAIKTDSNTKFLLKQIPDVVFARILKLVRNSTPFGLSLSDFTALYENNYEPLSPTLRQLRVVDVFHLFDIIKDEIPIVIRSIDGHKRAFLTSKEELSKWTVRQTRASRFIIPISLVDTPPNVVLPGDIFRPMQLPERFKAGNYEYVAVYISSAVNPHEIYIQFKGAEYHTALENLMMTLDFYDTADEEQWSVPFEFVYVGYPVICRYPGDKYWHRARISRIHSNDRRVVTVSFIDYGGTHVLDFKNLRLMKKEFLSLPVQALKVGLFGIRPILGNRASDWTASARDKLLRFSRQQYALACTLLEVRPDNYWVAICDTNTAVDVFLHLVLVNDKHALLSDDNPSETPIESSFDINTKINGNYMNGCIAQTNGV